MKAIVFLLSLFFYINVSYSQAFELEYTLEAHYSEVTFLTFNKAGTILLSGDKNGQILAWNTQIGKPIKRFLGHSGEITHLEFDTSNKRFVSASYDGTCRVWNFETQELLKTVENTSRTPYTNVQGNELTFALFLNEEHIVYGGYNMQVNKTNLVSSTTQKIFETTEAGITSAILLKETNQLVLGVKNNILLFDLSQKTVNTKLKKTDLPDDYICELSAINNKDNLIAAWTYDGKVQIWDISEKSLHKEMRATTSKGSNQFCFSKDGKILLTGNADNTAILWNTLNDEPIQVLNNNDKVLAIAMTTDDTYIATGDANKQIKLWKKKVETTTTNEIVLNNISESLIPPERMEEYKRTIDVQETITVSDSLLKISIYDDEQEDGDILSLFFNGHLIVEKYTLQKAKKVLMLTLLQEENHLVIHAHNEGDIPPNTTAIYIECGDFRKRVSLDSKMDTSAALKINFTQ